MFYYLRSKSDGGHDNLSGRQDILNLNLDGKSFYSIEQENNKEEHKEDVNKKTRF